MYSRDLAAPHASAYRAQGRWEKAMLASHNPLQEAVGFADYSVEPGRQVVPAPNKLAIKLPR